MATTTNDRSLLWQLRNLVPSRPVSLTEAFWFAELQASKFLQHSNIDEPGTPDELVSELRFVQVVARGDAPVAGGTIWLKPRWLIVLGDINTPARMRFSLFHEFKHVLDHGLIERLYPGSKPGRRDWRAEQAANHFAACALMPRRLVKRVWGQGLQATDELAAVFGVSEQAMQIRLTEMGLIDPRPRCLGMNSADQVDAIATIT